MRYCRDCSHFIDFYSSDQTACCTITLPQWAVHRDGERKNDHGGVIIKKDRTADLCGRYCPRHNPMEAEE